VSAVERGRRKTFGSAQEVLFALPVAKRGGVGALGRAMAGFVECMAKAADDETPDRARVAKADFRLRGMDVDVHFIAGKFNK
jgi:hypothetical protein